MIRIFAVSYENSGVSNLSDIVSVFRCTWMLSPFNNLLTVCYVLGTLKIIFFS